MPQSLCSRLQFTQRSLSPLHALLADAVIWRGPRKNGLIRQFLTDVEWGALDYLIIDTPPGTSDEHISIMQFLKGLPGLEGAVVITTPQVRALGGGAACGVRLGCAWHGWSLLVARALVVHPCVALASLRATERAHPRRTQEVSMADVRKELSFCKKTG